MSIVVLSVLVSVGVISLTALATAYLVYQTKKEQKEKEYEDVIESLKIAKFQLTWYSGEITTLYVWYDSEEFLDYAYLKLAAKVKETQNGKKDMVKFVKAIHKNWPLSENLTPVTIEQLLNSK